MDTTQLLLTVTLTVTTIFLIVVGVQLIFLLKEVRKTVRKVNLVIDGLEKAGLAFEHGFGEVLGFLTSFKTIFKIIDLIGRKKNARKS